MPKFEGDTSIGGLESRFEPTEWTRILQATSKKAVLDDLSSRYWKPLYCYLRRKGHNNDESKDLIQGFFSEIILGRDLVQKADRKRGKFRSLLLAALDNYVISVHRHKQSGQAAERIALGDDNIIGVTLTDPAEAFNYAWSVKLIDQVLKDLQAECCSDGKATHWEVFNAKFLRPIMKGVESPSLAKICADYGIPHETKVSNMIVTVKRRFRRLLERRIRPFVVSDAQVEEEIKDLIMVLSQSSASF